MLIPTISQVWYVPEFEGETDRIDLSSHQVFHVSPSRV